VSEGLLRLFTAFSQNKYIFVQECIAVWRNGLSVKGLLVGEEEKTFTFKHCIQ
jgi:hypothetical protein